MAYIYLVSRVEFSYDYNFGNMVFESAIPEAAFSLPELAEEFCQTKNLEKFRQGGIYLTEYINHHHSKYYKQYEYSLLGFDLNFRYTAEDLKRFSDQQLIEVLKFWDVNFYIVDQIPWLA